MAAQAHTPGNQAVYDAFRADPDLHLRTDLGSHYRCGELGIRRPEHEPAVSAWIAGRDAAIAKAEGQ